MRAALPPGKINHVIVIDFENEGYATTFGPGSAATYLNGTLRPHGELLQNYYATGHFSLDNYIAQVSGQAPTEDTQADCADNGFAFASVEPGTPDPNQTVNPGQVDGQGCVYPSSVSTIANQLDAKYPPNPKTSICVLAGLRAGHGEHAVTRWWHSRSNRGDGLRAPGHRRQPIPPSSQRRSTSTPPATTLSSGSTPSSTTRRSATPMSCPSGTLGLNGAPTPSRTPGTGPAQREDHTPVRIHHTRICVATDTTAPAPAPTAQEVTRVVSRVRMSSSGHGCR